MHSLCLANVQTRFFYIFYSECPWNENMLATSSIPTTFSILTTLGIEELSNTEHVGHYIHRQRSWRKALLRWSTSTLVGGRPSLAALVDLYARWRPTESCCAGRPLRASEADRVLMRVAVAVEVDRVRPTDESPSLSKTVDQSLPPLRPIDESPLRPTES